MVCDVVYAELAPYFADRVSLDDALQGIGAMVTSIDSSIAYEAGLRWKLCRASADPVNV